MARNTIAQTRNTTRGEASDARGVRMRRVLIGSLPLAALLALMALLILPATVSATGAGPGVTVTPPQGGQGTLITVGGTRFPSGDQITIGYGNADCSNVTPISGVGGGVKGDGSFSFSFRWPKTDKGSFTICATDTNSGTTIPSKGTFTVVDTELPAITISGPVAAGQQVTVTGAHFVATQPGASPGTVQILYGNNGTNGCGTAAGHTTINQDGTFTFSFNAPFVTTDTTFVVTAVVPEGSCGGSPTLQAQANLNVTAGASGQATPTPAQATPTAAPTATTAPAATATPGAGLVWPPTWPPSGPWAVVYCLVGLLLLLLLLLLLARRRRDDEPVTVQENDSVVVAPNQGAGGPGSGQAFVQRDIYAVDPRTQQRTPIAEEVTTVEEDVVDPNNPNNPNNPQR
ncbi:MAG TPA: hypothetical protein VFN11_02390 [Ktedonobacterales bacterium]|nr:hypothetical protein [Ktedonobacterales bacterium]